MDHPTIRTVEWASLTAVRPRVAGCNARLGIHGDRIPLPLARVTDSLGAQGFGWARVTPEAARALVGRSVAEGFSRESGAAGPWACIEFPLWDLAGVRAGVPVYGLLGGEGSGPLAVPVYDTSLYFDDLPLTDHGAAAELLAEEARQGLARGHRHFKVKVGRGARHLPVEAGMARDVAVVRAVRSAAGPAGAIMADANDGFTLNLAKRFLAETAEARLHWIEEPFHEDPVLLEDLQGWMRAEGLATVVADGEGLAAPPLMDWARRGLVQVLQYDVLQPGFSRWLAVGREADAAGVRSAPHHYGALYGNFASGHLAAAIRGFAFVEWDHAECPALDASAYLLRDGRLHIPARPGFGLALDEGAFGAAVRREGFVVGA